MNKTAHRVSRLAVAMLALFGLMTLPGCFHHHGRPFTARSATTTTTPKTTAPTTTAPIRGASGPHGNACPAAGRIANQ